MGSTVGTAVGVSVGVAPRLLKFATDFLYHAIGDAERVFHIANLESAAQLSWDRRQALISFTGLFRVSQCSHYDFKDDLCFSVSSDDILTPADVAI